MRANSRLRRLLLTMLAAAALAGCEATDSSPGGAGDLTAEGVARAWAWIPDPPSPEAKPEDLLSLAMHRLNGVGVERDLQKGIELLHRAANRGDPDAAYLIARLYEEGVGTPADPTGAVEWLERAAEFGHPEAQYRLGLAYYRGEGRGLNTVAGVRWLKAAAESGNANAQYALGIAYHLGRGTLRDEVRAVSWLEQAAAQDHVAAQYLVGDAYSDGWSAPADAAWAARWYGRAAWLGLRPAQYKMALFYLGGFGVPKNLVQAYKWARLATADGQQGASDLMHQLERQLPANEIRFGQALAAAWRPPLPAAVEAGPDRSAVEFAQYVLAQLGYKAGTVDGNLGADTRRALIAYQTVKGLPPDGALTAAVLRHLKQDRLARSRGG
jgi:TPR repeat protein